ncbi:MAG: tRNA lysidine(34) synthetase TilS, partial [Chloroflexi bacterium]
MMGIELVVALPRKRRVTSYPSISGIMTSSRMRSGFSLWAMVSAWCPLLAATIWYPWRCSIKPTRRSVSTSSSTISIFSGMAAPLNRYLDAIIVFTMLERFHSILQQKCHIESAKPVVVGVSGGPDSLCLLDLMARLGYSLVVAHLHHGLRSEAGADAEAVGRAAQALGVPFELQQVDVPALAQANSLSIEEAARVARYRFLFEQARRWEAQAVAVAHTADDQVETVLMHLLRGAGLAGLKGMQVYALPNAWSREIALIRPLLEFWRAEIEGYIQQRGLQPVIDQSNFDTKIYRNRLRHELIPYLQQYNPGVKQVVWRTAAALAGDYQALEKASAAAWDVCVLSQVPGAVAFSLALLRLELPGIQRMLLRRAISLLKPGLRDIDFEAIERALAFISTPPHTGQMDLAAGLRLLLEGDRLWLSAWLEDLPGEGWPQVQPKGAGRQPLALPVPGEIDLGNGWTLAGETHSAPDLLAKAVSNTSDCFQAWVDEASLPAPLSVRCRLPGDRFSPLGMDGQSLKLSDFMINVKMPRRARAGWPLVVS